MTKVEQKIRIRILREAITAYSKLSELEACLIFHAELSLSGGVGKQGDLFLNAIHKLKENLWTPWRMNSREVLNKVNNLNGFLRSAIDVVDDKRYRKRRVNYALSKTAPVMKIINTLP
jgi:hypothetical protein